MSRRKRASMREGPLADLFRSTSDDAPADPPEMKRPEADPPAREQPRYGREDPVEAQQVEETAQQRVEEPPAANEGSTEAPPERLKRVFSEEPRHQRRELEPIVETPRYGREEPEYAPPGSGEPHTPVIRVVGVGGAGVNAINRMVEARIPGVEFLAVPGV